jgi:hypothetical protein
MIAGLAPAFSKNLLLKKIGQSPERGPRINTVISVFWYFYQLSEFS